MAGERAWNLAPYVVGSWVRRKGHPFLYLRDSEAPGGERTIRCKGQTITDLCDLGVLEEEHTPTGGITDCSCRRRDDALPVKDIAKARGKKP